MTSTTHTPTPPLTKLTKLTPAALADAVVQNQHEDLIAQLMAPWFKAAAIPVRDALRQTMKQWHMAQAEIAEVFARVTSIEAFAEPRLKTALEAYGWGHIDPKTHGLQQVRLLKNVLLFIANQQLKVVDTVIQLSVPERLIPESLELNLTSSISQHDLLQACLHNFEANEAVDGGFDPGSVIYASRDNQLINVPGFHPELFAKLCRDLNVGEQYQWHLDSVFKPLDNEFSTTDPRSKAHKLKMSFSLNKRYEFLAELHVAYMKGHVTAEDYSFVLNDLLSTIQNRKDPQNTHSTLKIMDFEVPGLIVLWPEKKPASEPQRCLVYLSQAPQQAFYEFKSVDQLKTKLREWLKQPEFANYFVKRVPLRHRAEFIRRTDLKNVTWDSLLLRRPPIIYEPAIFSESKLIAQTGDPFEVAWLSQLAQIKDDARLLAVPTEDEDSKTRLARQTAFLNAGLSALTLVLGFVPVVGEVMLLFGVVQLGTSVYDGIKAWQRHDKVAALEHLFDVAQNLALIAAPGAAKALKPSAVVDRLSQVTLENGQMRLWKPDLTPYERRPALLAGLKPDAQGVYTLRERNYIEIEQKVYRVKGDVNTGRLSIEPGQNSAAYSPSLSHNGSGAWTHELDTPMQWSRTQLFQRLGPDVKALSEATAERILLATDTSESVLRRMYTDNLQRPPLLADCIQRVRLSEQIEHFSTQMQQGLHANVDLAPMQLDLLPRLPGWPQEQALRVVDLQHGTFKDYGPNLKGNQPSVQITQTRIDQGELLKATLESLSDGEIETLLGAEVSGSDAQAKALVHRLGDLAQTTKHTVVSRFYTPSEPLTPALRNIRNQFPSLPVNVLEELAGHLTSDEHLILSYLGRLPLHALEEARRYVQKLRLNRALEGLFYQALSNTDSQTLAWNTLPRLNGWPKNIRIELRNRFNNEQLSLIEGDSQGPGREIYKLGEQYEYYDKHSGNTFSSPDLMACVFKSLSADERLILNSGEPLSYSAFMSRIATQAAKQRASSAQALGMHPVKPWFKSPMRLADGRVGYTLGGRSGHLLDENKAVRLKDLASELYPSLSDTQVGQFLYQLRLTPALAARELVRLKAELETLRKTLLEWQNTEVWTYPLRGQRRLVPAQIKQQMSLALIRAWRRLTGEVNIDGHTGYELDLNSWPVDALPPLAADFRHISSLRLSNTACGIPAHLLVKFPQARALSLSNNQLTDLPAAIETMPELAYLNLRNNRIALTPEGADTLSTMTKLKSLDLTGNPLGQNFAVHRMTDLQHLSMRYTGLNTWPQGVETLSQLQTLDLRNNAISHIPGEILTPQMAGINRVTSLHDNPLTPDSIRRLELYRDQHRISLGLSPARQHATRRQGINRWTTRPSMEQSSVWSALHREQGSEDFFSVIEDLSMSSQFESTREDLTRRVWTLLHAAHDNTVLRHRLFALAQHLRTCSDGIAMVFADMELDHQVFLAQHSVNTEQSLLKLARGLFRIETLNAHVLSTIEARINAIHVTQSEHVQQLQELIDAISPDFASSPLAEMSPVEQQGVAYRLGSPEGLRLAELLSPDNVQRQIAQLDPLEIQMFYHVSLASSLDLPARPTSMRFDHIADVFASELETAKRYVLEQEQTPALIQSIAGQEFWSDYLQKKKPDVFKTILNEHAEHLDEVYTQRSTLSSDAYKRESERIAHERKKAIADVVTLLTRRELEATPLPAQVVPGGAKSTDV